LSQAIASTSSGIAPSQKTWRKKQREEDIQVFQGFSPLQQMKYATWNPSLPTFFILLND
jgi:hypothetical protein